MFVIMFVSRDVDQASEMLDVWVKAGVKGVTILESAGLSQLADKGIRDDLGIIFSLRSLTRAQEIHHRTLFSVVQDQATLDRVIKKSTDYVKDWSHPDVGVMFVWPVTQAFGLDKNFPPKR
jgi:nitrogen regulatory protein PII